MLYTFFVVVVVVVRSSFPGRQQDGVQAADTEEDFDSVTTYDCGTSSCAWNDHIREITGLDPEKICNCWNCGRPLTRDGYFPGIRIDWTDPKNEVLVAAVARLIELCPLPKVTFGCPVKKSTSNIIETEGSFCSIGCVKRYAVDKNPYNESDVDSYVSVMALEHGIDLTTLYIAPPVNTLEHRGGIYTYDEYRVAPEKELATPITSDLLLRKPTTTQVVEKTGKKQVKSLYSAFLIGSDIARVEPVQEKEEEREKETEEVVPAMESPVDQHEKKRSKPGTPPASPSQDELIDDLDAVQEQVPTRSSCTAPEAEETAAADPSPHAHPHQTENKKAKVKVKVKVKVKAKAKAKAKAKTTPRKKSGSIAQFFRR